MGAAPSLQKLGPQTTATPTQNVGGQSIYLNGEYLTKNPLWHLEESAWKAAQITRMLQKNQISPLTVCDVGCGAGEVLRQLQKTLASDCKLYGYDVSPQAIDLAAGRANERLHFCLEDFCTADGVWFDLLLALDVLEHVEDDRAGLLNMFSVLRPGGRAIVLVPEGMSIYGTLDEVLGHCRRYSEEELRGKFADAGFHVETVIHFNRPTRPAWFVNGRILKRRRFSRFQVLVFDRLVWFWRKIDRLLPWKPTSIIAVGVRPH